LEFLGAFFWGSVLFISRHLFPKTGIYNYHFNNKYKLTISIAFILLLLTYTNVLISGELPLFSQGYISRFEYIETTRLWPILRIFGVTTIIIPMLIGIAGYSANNRSKKIVSTLLLLLYLFYILLIGQKFGGLVFGLYYYLMPRIISSEGIGIKISPRLVVSITSVCLLAFITVFYHYSKYSLAQEYGGVINFIFYRIFGMQGHLWWGVDRLVWERSDMFNVSWNGFLNGMQYMMQMISPSIASYAISRGVNFTFGFYAFIWLLSGYLAPLFFIFIATVWILFARFVRSFAFDGIIPFVGLIYLHLWFVSFFSLGNISSVLSAKFILVLSILSIYFIINLKARSK